MTLRMTFNAFGVTLPEIRSATSLARDGITNTGMARRFESVQIYMFKCQVIKLRKGIVVDLGYSYIVLYTKCEIY